MADTQNSTVREWREQVDILLDQISDWAREQNWLVDAQETTRSEDELGTYATRVLTIQTSDGRLIVEPVARFVAGAEGRVDLYAWPSLNRVRLLRCEAGWVVRTDSELDYPQPWERDTFVGIARELVRAA